MYGRNRKQATKTQLSAKLDIKLLRHWIDTFILIQMVASGACSGLLDAAEQIETTTSTIPERNVAALSSNISSTQNAFKSLFFESINQSWPNTTTLSNSTAPIILANNSMSVLYSENGTSTEAAPSSTSTRPTKAHNDDDDNIVISSSEILPDNRHSNYLPNMSSKQQTINVLDLNCSSKNNNSSLDLFDSVYAELDIQQRMPNDGDFHQDNNSNSPIPSPHYSNSRHILRILVVGLFGLVCLSLTIVYAIKFCLCGKRKRQYGGNISRLRRSCSSRRNYVIDVEEIERNHFIHSACSCSNSNSASASASCLGTASVEIPAISSSQSNSRFQSLFRPPDFLISRNRISDGVAKFVPNLPQLGFNNNSTRSTSTLESNSVANLGCDSLPAQNQSISPSSLCRQLGPNFDRLHSYRYCHNHYHHQYNHASTPSSLLPLLTPTNCHCLLPNVDQFVTQPSATLPITHLDNLTPPTIEPNVAPQATNDQQQLDPQQRPPAYHELFGNQTESFERESRGTDGATQFGQSEADSSNNESSNDMSSTRGVPQAFTYNQSSSTTTITNRQQQQLQQDQKNLLVKLNLNKTKLLSAGDLMLLSKLIDVPIVVQQQQQRQQQQQQQHNRQYEAGRRDEETTSSHRAFVEVLERNEP